MINEQEIIEIFQEHYTRNIWNEVDPLEYHLTEDKFGVVSKAIKDKIKEKEKPAIKIGEQWMGDKQ